MALFFFAMPLAGASFLRLPIVTAATSLNKMARRNQVVMWRQWRRKLVEDKFGRHKLFATADAIALTPQSIHLHWDGTYGHLAMIVALGGCFPLKFTDNDERTNRLMGLLVQGGKR